MGTDRMFEAQGVIIATIPVILLGLLAATSLLRRPLRFSTQRPLSVFLTSALVMVTFLVGDAVIEETLMGDEIRGRVWKSGLDIADVLIGSQMLLAAFVLLWNFYRRSTPSETKRTYATHNPGTKPSMLRLQHRPRHPIGETRSHGSGRHGRG
jgi:hypothetical protein